MDATSKSKPRYGMRFAKDISAGPWEGRYPRYVWGFFENFCHEARLTNRTTGQYKGYTLSEDDELPVLE